MPPDLSDELREEVVLFFKRVKTAGLEQTRPCSLSFPTIVTNERRLCMLRHVLPRFALNVLCHPRTATSVVPMVPQCSQKWATPLFWAASSIQRDVAPTGDVQRMSTGDEGHIQSTFLRQIVALRTFAHTSTKAPTPCGAGQYSLQRSRKHRSPTC